MDVDAAADECRTVLDEVSGAVIADREFLETVMNGLLAQGHVLLEDVPGTGKTLTARSIATALGLSFKRVQFTPDLLPTDVLGTNIYNEQERSFEFQKGPVFANVVLADEINRAPPKTQSALLEAMEEGQVTVDGETRQLPEPFFVIATQNPVEQEGSLHPEETLYMNGELWTAADALEYARSTGEIIHDGETTLYEAGTTTTTLDDEGNLIQSECYVYETEYDGSLYTIETKTGRTIQVSGNHPFLVNRAGTLQWVEARDLQEEDFLASPDELPVPETPFPDHETALEEAVSGTEWSIITESEANTVREQLAAGKPLDREALNIARIAAGLSKTEFADRVSENYDRVLNYLAGADTDVGATLTDALDPAEIQSADHIEAYRCHSFTDDLDDDDAGFFIGLVLSDGHIGENSVEVHQTNYPELLDRWVALAEQLGFDPRIREKDGGREAVIDSTPLVNYLEARYDIRNPESFISAPEPFRAEFVEAFVLAEGHFDAENRRLTITQADRETTNIIAHMLLSFGIRPWVKDRGRVYRIKIQGEDIATYCEQFRWPGDMPDVNGFQTAHRVTPVAESDVEAVVDRLGLKYDDLSDRSWYNSFRSGRERMADDAFDAFLTDAAEELEDRLAIDARDRAESTIGDAARECGLSLTDVVDGTDCTCHAIRQAYEGAETPEEAVSYVADTRDERLQAAEEQLSRLQALSDSDVFFDRIRSIESEPYEGTVIGLSVPETHNYLAGLGGCGINHNTFPLPEAQMDRFMVKSSIGYPDDEGELELLRRRAGRTAQAPSVSRVLDPERVDDLRAVPESVRVEEDILSYMTAITRATREDYRVDVGVSPRGTQRLFESARARAVIQGREFVTPDDVKGVAEPALAHRLVLTPDATVENVEKRDVIQDVLDETPVPTVE